MARAATTVVVRAWLLLFGRALQAADILTVLRLIVRAIGVAQTPGAQQPPAHAVADVGLYDLSGVHPPSGYVVGRGPLP
ncbi:hypothetical protein NKDENANG_01032 [Candidatus Entotheonellaceae bacterium PAL068K]